MHVTFKDAPTLSKGVPATNTQSSSNSAEECNDEGWCVAKAGTDVFGLPKVVGWEYKSTDNGIHYGSPKLYKIRHKAAQIAIQHVSTYNTITKKPPQEHLATTKPLDQQKESVATIPMAPITVTQQIPKGFGSLESPGSLEAHASLSTPGSTTAKTIPMRITTAANSEENGKSETKLKHALALKT